MSCRRRSGHPNSFAWPETSTHCSRSPSLPILVVVGGDKETLFLVSKLTHCDSTCSELPP
eukprot:12902811-Prorocentrum_lima.AAC.1